MTELLAAIESAGCIVATIWTVILWPICLLNCLLTREYCPFGIAGAGLWGVVIGGLFLIKAGRRNDADRAHKRKLAEHQKLGREAESKLRKLVGIALRLPIVVVLGVLWVATLWWVCCLVGITAAVAILILKPLAYPILYSFTWLSFAFQNRAGDVLPDYWDGYPDLYLEGLKKAFKFGFPTLREFLLEGFGSGPIG